MEKQLQDLEQHISVLEKETERLAHNCQRISNYQRDLFHVCHTWLKWIDTSIVTEADNKLMPKTADSCDNC